MKTIAYPCCLPGCVDGCIFQLPDTTRIEHHSQRTNPTLWHCAEPFDVELTIPHCTKEQEREKFRVETFAKANTALEQIDASQYTSVYGLIKAEKDAWNQFARQWWDGPCPFYSPVPSDPGAPTIPA